MSALRFSCSYVEENNHDRLKSSAIRRGKGSHNGGLIYQPTGNMLDITGQRFGRLTVLCLSGFTPERSSIWLCLCDCGRAIFRITSRLKKNSTTISCGCISSRLRSEAAIRHGGSQTRLYRIWNGMKVRCYLTTHPRYADWGGRGIDICDDWRESFVNFRVWAHSNRYESTLSIERLDNNKGYSPENCIWATRSVQANNRRTSRIITHKGERFTVTQWSRKTNLTETAIRLRIDRYGWSVEDALTKKSRRVKQNG